MFEKTKIVYNLHHGENKGIFDNDRILELLGLPEDVDRASLMHDGKVDMLRLGLQYSDYVVTGNHLKDQFDSLFKELDISPTKIQGSPEDVSAQFADYYSKIAP